MNHPLISDSQYISASQSPTTYDVATEANDHHTLHRKVKTKLLYAKKANPILDLMAVMAVTSVEAAKGIRFQTIYV
eukprot:CAMPEP_0170818742 /NCGR_PEP_ID=MMETSP0733-20121128/40960_1 /TAXON_ID=186038 /ORGANISM="Fragilariopsis kerguelensis, Strain L26-C5" /LENGTH=75 /DNA_ID=CAMNT_0011178999 /DNA_START=462 /DNA_END=689 /DNA_ORIENTATION=-